MIYYLILKPIGVEVSLCNDSINIQYMPRLVQPLTWLVKPAIDYNGNYTWLKDGLPLRNEHNQELVLPSVDINDEGQYQCSVWELHYQLYPTCMSIVH